jgi:VanZ family protein
VDRGKSLSDLADIAVSKRQRSDWLRRALWLALIAGCALLFVHEPAASRHRLLLQSWNLGHLWLFGIIGFFVGERLAQLSWRGFALALMAGALAGGAIELLQLAIGRDCSLDDVIADTIGMAAGLLLGARTSLRRHRALFGFATACVAVALAMQLWPVLRSAVDAYNAWREFPVLADFENGALPSLQRERFGGTSADLIPEEGALRVALRAGRYPGFSLDDFPRDWRGWHSLVVDLDNPSGTDLAVTCRIHDARHNQQYSDRFNRRLVLQPGRQQLRIDLAAVAVAPRGRAMDMSAIHFPMCFAIDLAQPRDLRIHAIRLE